MVIVTHDPIDPSRIFDSIARESSGSVVFHYAVVKTQSGDGGKTSCIEYAPAGDTVAEMEKIASTLRDAWQLEDLLIIRRVGCLGIGDIISLVAASSPNSEDAFAACRGGIARLKKMETIRKTEVYR